MKDFPRNGEVWWLSDVLVVVLFDDRFDAHGRPMVAGLTLFDLDEVFDPGEEFEWSLDKLAIHEEELSEPNRRIA